MNEKKLFFVMATNCLMVGSALLICISSLLDGKYLMAQIMCFIGAFLVFLLATYSTKCMSGTTLIKNTLTSMALSFLIGQENSLAQGSAIVLCCAVTLFFCAYIVCCTQRKSQMNMAGWVMDVRLIIGLALCLTTGTTIGQSLGVLLYEKIPEYQYQIQCEEEVSKLKDVKLEDHLDALYCVINPAEWTVLSDEEKKTCYQLAGDIERTCLNLPYELRVVTLRLDEYTRGQYNPQTHTIEINELLLHQNTGIEGLETICHEARHAYQHELVAILGYIPAHLQELEAFDEAIIFSSEFEHYATEGEEYFNQTCEQDSREYAEEGLNEYLYRLLKYGEENQRCIVNDKED